MHPWTPLPSQGQFGSRSSRPAPVPSSSSRGGRLAVGGAVEVLLLVKSGNFILITSLSSSKYPFSHFFITLSIISASSQYQTPSHYPHSHFIRVSKSHPWPFLPKKGMAFFLTLGFVSGYIDTCDFLRHKHLSSSVSAKVAIVIRKGMDKSWVNSGPIGLHGGLSCQKWQASHSSCQTWLLSQVGVTDSMNRFPHVCWSPTSSCHFLPNRLGPSDPPIRFQRADPETAAQQARTRILHIGPYRFI